MMITSLLLLTGICAAPAFENAVPLRVTGPWSIEIGPGKIGIGGKEIAIANAAILDVAPPEVFPVRDEVYSALPVYNKDAAGWTCGVPLRAVQAEECTGTDLLLPNTLRVKPGRGDATAYIRGTDFDFEPKWATFGRVDGGKIAARQSVFVDYDHTLSRLDTIAVNKDGKVRIVRGKPVVALAFPPELEKDELTVANVWVPGYAKTLTDENLYPIDFSSKQAARAPVAEKLLPKTLAKLRSGEPVTIVAFGDSVTCGGGVGALNELWYQNQFLMLLQERFPKASIRMLTAGWGGANSQMYLDAPKGGVYDFARDVLEPKPDMVTIEFVNDAYFDEDGTAKHYAKLVELIGGCGAEIALITPHLVRADWLKSDTMKFDEDPRPYVNGLRKFAASANVALADASAEWCGLWRQGIPYITLLANDINHPDGRGQAIFARALLGLFPEK